MEKKIDWSKAPVWANAVVSSEEGDEFYVSQWGGISARQRVTHKDAERHRCADMIAPHAWTLVETRQSAWNGKGLPPVGAICETLDEDADAWVPVRVFAHTEIRGKNHAVSQDENDMFFGLAHDYRPIKTAEQIAAEERENAVSEMVDTLKRYNSIHEACGMLYDANYRKQVAK